MTTETCGWSAVIGNARDGAQEETSASILSPRRGPTSTRPQEREAERQQHQRAERALEPQRLRISSVVSGQQSERAAGEDERQTPLRRRMQADRRARGELDTERRS